MIATRSRECFCLMFSVISCFVFFCLSVEGFTAPSKKEIKQLKQELDLKKKRGTRDYFSMLTEVLDRFEGEVKNGLVRFDRDFAFRFVRVSESVPEFYSNHLEGDMTDIVLRYSRGKPQMCVPCRSKVKQATHIGERIDPVIVNDSEWSEVAERTGIFYYVDVDLSFQKDGMVLGVSQYDAVTRNLLWARSYFTDIPQPEIANHLENEQHPYLIDWEIDEDFYPFNRVYGGAVIEPGIVKSAKCMQLGIRRIQPYGNYRFEAGLQGELIREADEVMTTGSAADLQSLVFSRTNIGVSFVNLWLVHGSPFMLGFSRGYVFGSLGGNYASGYLGGVIRAGYEYRVGTRWSASAHGGYRPSSTVYVDGVSLGKVGGLELGAGLGILF